MILYYIILYYIVWKCRLLHYTILYHAMLSGALPFD